MDVIGESVPAGSLKRSIFALAYVYSSDMRYSATLTVPPLPGSPVVHDCSAVLYI